MVITILLQVTNIKIDRSIYYTGIVVSFLTTVCLSALKLIAVKLPFCYKQNVHTRSCVYILAFFWYVFYFIVELMVYCNKDNGFVLERLPGICYLHTDT